MTLLSLQYDLYNTKTVTHTVTYYLQIKEQNIKTLIRWAKLDIF